MNPKGTYKDSIQSLRGYFIQIEQKIWTVPHWAKIEVPTLDSDDRSKIIDLKSLMKIDIMLESFKMQ